MQGPTALDVLTKANGGALPKILFFNMGELNDRRSPRPRTSPRNAGTLGMELFGPWDEAEDVRAALIDAGRDAGLRQVGSRVYATNTLESGWIPCPCRQSSPVTR